MWSAASPSRSASISKWEGRVIETKKGVVRLIPVLERAKQLFGEDGAEAVADRLENASHQPAPADSFPDMDDADVRAESGPRRKSGAEVSDEIAAQARGATTLDRVHAAMLLQAGGRTNALRALHQGRAGARARLPAPRQRPLGALPKGSEEKRLLDAMLLAVPR